MTVKEFVKKYGDAKNQTAKDAILKGLKVKDYVDVTTKDAYIRLVVKNANAEYDKDGNMLGQRYNSIMQHVLFTVTMVQLYTDLDIDFKREQNPDNVAEVYDLLNKNNLINKIMELIGEKELNECMLFLSMASNDFSQNEMSLQAYIGKKIDNLGTLVTTLSELDEFNKNFSANQELEQIDAGDENNQ